MRKQTPHILAKFLFTLLPCRYDRSVFKEPDFPERKVDEHCVTVITVCQRRVEQ